MLFSNMMGSRLSFPSNTPEIVVTPIPVQLLLSVNDLVPGFDAVIIRGNVKNSRIFSNFQSGQEFELYERAFFELKEGGIIIDNTPYTVTTPLSSSPHNTEIELLGLVTPYIAAQSPTGTVDYTGTSLTYVVGYKFIGQTQLKTEAGLTDCAMLNEIYTNTL